MTPDSTPDSTHDTTPNSTPSTTDSTNTGDIHAGSISFVARYESELTDGDYEVLVGHRVASRHAALSPAPVGTPPPEKLPFDEAFVSRQRIRVEGLRFSLPAGMVTAYFPPVECTGEYEAVLPHLVLQRKTLPWERTAAAPGSNNGTPWLAVLVFHASDAPAGQQPAWEARAAMVSELLSTPPGVVSYPGFALEGSQTNQDRCQLISIPAALWALVAPRLADLPWLAHGRDTTGPGASSGAVVIANRLPHLNQRCTAHLVSLEGMHAYLPGEPGMPGSGSVRLISLASWSFTSNDPQRTFVKCVESLSVGPLQVPGPTAINTEGQARVAQAFAMGYTAKNHHTRAADRTVSWYRGPLLPGRLPPDDATARVVQRGKPVHTPDELLRYDPSTGLMDAGYAAAWQVGRLLMLQNTSVATALAQWKHSNILQAAVALERAALNTGLMAIGVPDITSKPSGFAEAVHRAGAKWLSQQDLNAVPVPPGIEPLAAPIDTRFYFHAQSQMGDLPEVAGNPALWNDTHCGRPLPPEVLVWRDRLRLLHGVPAPYLIADMSSLPDESLRFFQLDSHWITVLVEGAFSIGRTSKTVRAHDSLHHDAMHGTGDPALGASALLLEPSPVSGCLLHSSVVFDWPGLEIRGYGQGGVPLAPLRPAERLTPKILFCLFDGKLAQIELREPTIGLHFGFEREGPDAGPHTFTKPLRLPDADPVPVPFHNLDERVVDIHALALTLQKSMPPAGGGGPG